VRARRVGMLVAMELPVIKSSGADADYIGHYLRARAEFHQLGLESQTLDLGTAIRTPQLARLHDANQIVLARVPAGVDVAAGWAEAEAHFAAGGTTCLKLTFSPAATEAERSPLVELLSRNGWRDESTDVYALRRATPGVTHRHRVISARAAMAKYESFARAAAAAVEPQLADVAMVRLDDPRWEVLCALHEGDIVARAGMLSLGEIGLIDNVRVLDARQGRGFGRAVMEHAIDLCSRAQFKHVVLGCSPTNARAIALYEKLGFARVGESTSWFHPSTAHHR
jgi:ribosomal protein S18 acetylase RimI-like enzyme